MSDKIVHVNEVTQDNAILLLDAAQALELDPGVVATTSFGRFEVPEAVAKKAGVDYTDPDADSADADEPKATGRAAKKAAAPKNGE